MASRCLAIAVMALVFTSAPSTALISQLANLLPDGFPYIGGVCGVGTSYFGLAIGLNCGSTQTKGGSFSCHQVTGGHNCDVNYEGFGQVFRWINAGVLHAEMYGSCSDTNMTSWDTLGALLPLTVGLACSIHMFIPQGQCQTVRVYVSVSFEGAYAPPTYTVGPDEIGLCP